MIQDSDVYQTQSISQPCRYQLVGLRRFCDPARVWVGKDHGRGVLLQGFLDHFPRMNGRSVDRALEHFLVADQAVAFVEEDYGEDFSLEGSELEGQSRVAFGLESDVPRRTRRDMCSRAAAMISSAVAGLELPS